MGQLDTSILEDYATVAALEEVERVSAAALNQLNEAIENISLTTGPQGETGATGAQGPKGDTGDTGTFDTSALADYATKTYVNEAIAEVVGAAPDALNTLQEIAEILDNDATGSAGIVQQITELRTDLNNISLTPGPQGETGATGPQGPQGPTGTFDSSALEDYVTTTGLAQVIGELGNKVEAADAVYGAIESGTTLTSGNTYYTSSTGAGEFVSDGTETADGSNYFELVSEAVTAVPYTSVAEVITDNEEVVAAALTDLQAKYEALLARVVALEGTGATE